MFGIIMQIILSKVKETQISILLTSYVNHYVDYGL